MKNKKVLVVLGGTSGEREVSLDSGRACIKALKKIGYNVSTFDPKKKQFNSIDPNKTDQGIRGVTSLPNGTGKSIKVAVLTKGDKQTEAKEAGADLVGDNELIDSISSGKILFDLLIASPDVMPSVGKVAKILGPKGLMPNPKLGTVTQEVATAVKNAKTGRVQFKNDKSGIVHAGIGKMNFNDNDLLENLKFFYTSINKSKPDSVKGSFIKKVTIASTMGVGLEINVASLR